MRFFFIMLTILSLLLETLFYTEIILKLAKQQIERSMPSMIFCNDSPTSFFLKHLLEENGITSAIINGKMQEKVREQAVYV